MSDLKKEPTAAEAMLFFSIVKHTKNKADVDWNAVAAESGFKSADVAKVRFGQIKRKLGISTEATPSPRGPVTPRKTPGGITGKITPSKVTKTPRSKVKKDFKQDLKQDFKQEDQYQDEDEDEDEDQKLSPYAVKVEGLEKTESPF